MLLLLPLTIVARDGDTRHSLGFSVGGGGALQVQKSELYTLKPRLGADAQAELFYSLRHNRFVWEIGGAFDWDRTQQRIGDFTNEIWCLDNDAIPENLFFRYHYTNMIETQQMGWVGGQTRFGLHFTDQLYGMVGVKIATPVFGSYRNTSDLMTDGFYPTDIDPHGNDASYAFYPEVKMAYGEELKLHPLLISPTLELGGEFLLSASVSLRAALYGEYVFPIMLETNSLPLTIYTQKAVTDPCNQSLQELQSAVKFSSLMGFNDGSGLWQRARFGLKLTLLIHPSTPEHCNCLNETPLRRRKGGTLILQNNYHVRRQNDDF